MPKKTRFIWIVACALSILFLLSVSRAALAAPPQAAAHSQSLSNQTHTLHLAFTALTTKGSGAGTLNAPVSAGGTLHIQQSGSFTGTFDFDFGFVAPVQGHIQRNGDITFTITFPESTIVHLQGHFNHTGEAVGTYQFFVSGKPGRSGIWSAQSVSDVDNLLTFGLAIQVTKGPNAGVVDSQALVLNKKTLRGTVIDASGSIFPASVQFAQGNLLLIINFGHGFKVFATAIPVTSQGVTSYQGTFVGAAPGDAGKFFAFPFGFAA